MMDKLKFVDLSYANGIVDFDKLKADGVQGVLVRCSYGVGFKDVQYERNISEARRVGFLLVHYHFTYPNLNSAQAEADYFASVVDLRVGEKLAQDYEIAAFTGNADAWAKTFEDSVATHFSGYHPDFYSYLALIRQKGFPSVIAEGDPLWLAAFDGNPDTRYSTGFREVEFKQYTDKGSEAGVNGAVDEDVFYGTVDTFRQSAYQGSISSQKNMDTYDVQIEGAHFWTGNDATQAQQFWSDVKGYAQQGIFNCHFLKNGEDIDSFIQTFPDQLKTLNTTIETLTQQKNAAADDLTKISQELTALQTKEGLDQDTIVKLNAQVSQLNETIGKLKEIQNVPTISPTFIQKIFQYFSTLFHH